MKCLGLVLTLVMLSCHDVQEMAGPVEDTSRTERVETTTTRPEAGRKEAIPYDPAHQTINTHNVTPQEVVEFAKTMIGTPYLYASVDPAKGFDCSGFITYVFNHFNISVPRSSIDFTNVQREIPLEEAKPGDIVLFTGTDTNVHHVGHMGILTSEGAENSFIHSTSGKAYGVTITPLNGYYMRRFVKVIRVFKQNDVE